MDLEAEKTKLRRLALARRDALSPEERAARSLALCRHLAALPELREGAAVLGYLPVGSECDLSALFDALRSRGVTLAFPVTEEGGGMEAYVPTGPLRIGRFSIPEPDPARSRRLAPEELGAVLVPCLAFDEKLHRLGHGGGYYDRYLPRCPAAAAVLTAFEAQRLPSLPRAAHDAALSLLVTEAGVFRK